MLFADDSLLFFRANVEQAQYIRDALSVFERCIGQLLRPGKCSMLVRVGRNDEQIQLVRDTLGLERIDFEEKYLGLPTPNGRLKREVFQPLELRFFKRMTAWKEKELSAVGKEILIKSVVQALPNYIMSVFKLTDGLCEDLMKAIWDIGGILKKVGEGFNGFCGRQWCYLNTWGGFKDLILFNQALLAKQAWRLIFYPESLCARVLKAKYFCNGNLLDTVTTRDASQTWRAIEYGLTLLKKGAIWRVGDGSSIRIWRDNWIPRAYGMKPIRRLRPCRQWRSQELS
jgi:hypothetical protein